MKKTLPKLATYNAQAGASKAAQGVKGNTTVTLKAKEPVSVLNKKLGKGKKC